MKKFLIGLVAGILLAALTGLVLVFALVRLGETRPSIQQGSTLVMRLSGEVPERPPMQYPIPLLESSSPATIHEIWRMLKEAAEDDDIEALVLAPKGVSVGWAKLQEIRSGILKFKESGKPVVAYLRNPGGREYYLATAADRIHMSREDLLNLKGLRAELMFLRGTLDKLGIEVEIEHAGKYKNAGDMFTRKSMTPETREVLDSMLDILYADLLQTIGEARDIEISKVQTILDEGPFLARRAAELGLVDDLLFEDEVFENLKAQLNQEEIRRVSHRTYIKSLGPDFGSGQRIALVVGEGTILSGGGGSDSFGDDGALRSRSFARVLAQVRRDDRIQGAILRINSPGGDAIASDEILREIQLLREKKPIVVSMSDVAASGGYYIAMTGDPVLAYPNTVTGSIGVIYGKVNLRGLYDKLGIQKQYLTRGRFADIDTDYKPLSEEGREKLREGIDETYRNFLKVVSDGRSRDLEEIAPLAEGRTWLGLQALENGLVDELGGLDRAVELIKEKAEIPDSEEIRLVTYPRRRSLVEYLFLEREVSIVDRQIRRLLGGLDVRVFEGGRVLRLMPFAFEIE